MNGPATPRRCSATAYSRASPTESNRWPDSMPTTYCVGGENGGGGPGQTARSKVRPSGVTVLMTNGAIGVRANTVGVMSASHAGQSRRRSSCRSGWAMTWRSRSLHASAVPSATEPLSSTDATLVSAPRTAIARSYGDVELDTHKVTWDNGVRGTDQRYEPRQQDSD